MAIVLRETGSQRLLAPTNKPPRLCLLCLTQLDDIQDSSIASSCADQHTCSTCHERFHGICMRHAQCDRFFSESARSHYLLPFPSRSLTFSQRGVHRFPPKNMADPGDTPQDLHATLEGLTCAASPLPAFSWGSARTVNTGNVIIFSQDLVLLCTTLPRRTCRSKAGRERPRLPQYNDFRVRKHKVFSCIISVPTILTITASTFAHPMISTPFVPPPSPRSLPNLRA